MLDIDISTFSEIENVSRYSKESSPESLTEVERQYEEDFDSFWEASLREEDEEPPVKPVDVKIKFFPLSHYIDITTTYCRTNLGDILIKRDILIDTDFKNSEETALKGIIAAELFPNPSRSQFRNIEEEISEIHVEESEADPEDDSDFCSYEIDLIIDRKLVDGKEVYRCVWKGFDLNCDGREWWIERQYFPCKEIIEEYESREEAIQLFAAGFVKRYRRDILRFRIKYPNMCNRTHFQELDELNSWSEYLLELRKFEKSFMECLEINGEAPIYVENWTDEKNIPSFEYIQNNIIGDEARFTLEQLTCVMKKTGMLAVSRCNCTNKCESSCPCNKKSQLKFIDGSFTGSIHRGLFIVDCGPLCGCEGLQCKKSFSQQKRKYPLVLKYCGLKKGWGLYAATDIPPKTYLGRYTGQIILSKNLNSSEQSYAFDLVGHDDDDLHFCIDANSKGNETRFFNHSCKPNLVALNLYAAHNMVINDIVFVSRREILVGEELTFCYSKSQKSKGVKCLCSFDCNYYL